MLFRAVNNHGMDSFSDQVRHFECLLCCQIPLNVKYKYQEYSDKKVFGQSYLERPITYRFATCQASLAILKARSAHKCQISN